LKIDNAIQGFDSEETYHEIEEMNTTRGVLGDIVSHIQIISHLCRGSCIGMRSVSSPSTPISDTPK
jgi:hypothetical protein